MSSIDLPIEPHANAIKITTKNNKAYFAESNALHLDGMSARTGPNLVLFSPHYWGGLTINQQLNMGNIQSFIR